LMGLVLVMASMVAILFPEDEAQRLGASR
jgi:hypothetical protein